MKYTYNLVILMFGLMCSVQSKAQVNVYPYAEDWESEATCGTGCGTACPLANGWTNDLTDGQDWTVWSGTTGSANTGPTANGGADQNPGIAGGQYLYTETSSGCNGNVANLISPEFQNTASMGNIFFEFWYHMYGADVVNPITVDVRTVVGGVPGAWTQVSSIPAQNVDLWQQEVVDLSAYVGDTFQIQIGTVTGPSFGSDVALDDFSVYQILNNDAGVVSIDGPINPITPGVNNIDVTIQNFGANTLTTADIEWSVDGVGQTTFPWTGSLANGVTDGPLTIGTYNFPNGLFELKAWTANPNGVADSAQGNDTSSVILCTPLLGNYTVGGVGADFADMVELGNVLSQCGVSGDVNVTVNPGTYDGRMILDHVPGTGPNATITINGGDASLVTMTNSAGFSNIYFDGTDYTTIKNITLDNQGTNDCYGIQLRDTSGYNVFDSLIINMSNQTGLADVIGISASDSETSSFTEGQNAHHTTVSNCQIIGGEKAIHFEGQNALRVVGNKFWNNMLIDNEDYGIYIDDQDSLEIIGNFISGLQTTFADGIYCFDLMDFNISYNEVVEAPDYGIYIADGNFNLDGVPNGRGKVINNMVSSTSDYAMYFDDIEETDIWHNTAANTSTISGALRINDFTGLDIRNNIFYSNGDFAFECDEDIAATPNVVDYNSYWSTGPNLIDDGFTVHADLNSWQVAQPTVNVNSIEVDPFFVTSLSDLHVVSPLVNDLGDNTVGIADDIDGDTRPAGVNVDMGADEFTPVANDLSFVGFGDFPSCGDSLTPVYIVVTSLGADSVFTFNADLTLSGDGSEVINYTFNDTLVFGQTDTILVGTINTYWGVDYNLDGYVTLTGDANNSNDTLGTSFMVIPFEPVGINGYACGDTTGYIYATQVSGTTYNWFASSDQVNDTIPVGTGDSLMVPNYTIQDTYYLEYANNADSLITTYAGGNGCGGGNMFDLTALNAISINAMSVNTSAAVATVFNVTIHYIQNGTYVGNETNAGAWTTLGTFTGTSAGNGLPSYVDFGGTNLNIPAGQTWAIYVEFPANYTNGSFIYANADLSVQTGVGLCGSFASINNPRSFNGTIHYGSTACSNIRVPVTLEAGEFADPSFTSSATGGTVDFTSSGATQNTDYMWDFGDGNTSTQANPQHTYAVLDTTYNVCLTATASCGDSTSCQSIDVCEVMTADFSHTVLGLDATFTDLTTGVPTSWNWDFGDGNTSTMQNPTHSYADEGPYTVTLTTTNYCGDSSTVSYTYSAVSVDENTLENALVISPNPSSGVFIINYTGAVEGDVQLTVMDNQGKIVLTRTEASGEFISHIDLTSLADGIYFLNVTVGDNRITKQLIKE